MTQGNTLTVQPINQSSLIKCMLVGAAITLTLIAIFLLGVKHPKPEWGSLWMVKPLIIVPLAGAAGGAFFYLVGTLRLQGNWGRILTFIIGIIGFIIAFWLGSVLGLNGTLWN
jgi:hypothetical protein